MTKVYLRDLGYADRIVGKKILNLDSIGKDNELINYLIKNKYHKLYFTTNKINESVLRLLLSNKYNKPIIYNTNVFKLTTLELTYSPKIKTINLAYIEYIINENKKGDHVPCAAYGTFDKETVGFLYNQVFNEKSNEISGKLKFDKTIMTVSETIDNSGGVAFSMKLNKHMKGSKVEAEQVDSKYNFHTHPVSAYTHYNCELGWPSRDDYTIVIEAFIKKKNATVFHWLCTKEGIYVMSIPEKSVNIYSKLQTKEFTSRLNDYLNKYIEIDKLNFKKSIGVNRPGFGLIRDQYSYIDYINEVQKSHPFKININGKAESFKLIEIQFFEWEGHLGVLSNNNILFKYYFPKVDGNCLIDERNN